MARDWVGTGIGAWAATLFALLRTGASKQARTVHANQAPKAWVVYAERVSACFQAALEGDSAAARRFHAFLDRQAWTDGSIGTEDVPMVLRIRAWIDAAGRVTRIEFTPLGDPHAESDLR